MLRAQQVGEPRRDLERIQVRPARQAAHDRDHLEVRPLHRRDEAGGEVQRTAPGHAEQLHRRIGQHLGQHMPKGRAHDHLHVLRVGRGRGDIGLLQSERRAQRGLQFGAGGEGGVEGDAHQPAPSRLGQRLVHPQACRAQLVGHAFLRQPLDVIGPGDLRQEPLFGIDLGQLRRTRHGDPSGYFTAPMVRPRTRCFDASSAKIKTGITISVDVAMILP